MLKAFAEALAKKKDVRLTLVPFEGVEERAAALQARQADLAVVRSEVRMPDDGLTLAILRERAVLLLVLENLGITTLTDLAARLSGRTLIERVLGQTALYPSAVHLDGSAIARAVHLVPLDEAKAATVLAARKIDALVLITTEAIRPRIGSPARQQASSTASGCFRCPTAQRCSSGRRGFRC